MLSEAVEQAREKLDLVDGEHISSSSNKAAAWVLRKCFDNILQELIATV